MVRRIRHRHAAVDILLAGARADASKVVRVLPPAPLETQRHGGGRQRERVGDRCAPSSSYALSTIRCCANLAQGGALQASDQYLRVTALCQIRATLFRGEETEHHQGRSSPFLCASSGAGGSILTIRCVCPERQEQVIGCAGVG